MDRKSNRIRHKKEGLREKTQKVEFQYNGIMWNYRGQKHLGGPKALYVSPLNAWHLAPTLRYMIYKLFTGKNASVDVYTQPRVPNVWHLTESHSETG